MPKWVAITPAAIDNLDNGRICDAATPGLRIEALPSGKKKWKFRRRLRGGTPVIKRVLGPFPAYSIAEARAWARQLNEEIEAGIDPRLARRAEEGRAAMTVARAHALYMEAAREGRSSRAKRRNKSRTISDKLEIYNRDIAPALAKKIIHEVTEEDLVRLVSAKGKVAKIRANRLAAELKVFFGWAASLRGMEVGLESDPSRRLHDLRFPETARSRKLSIQEIEWFLLALVDEEREYQRGMLLWLLTGARLGEVEGARTDELVDGVWIIPAARTKNSVEHSVPLGPWGRTLMQSQCELVFPAPKRDGHRSRTCWHKARNRVKKRMESLAGRPIERFTPHDFRRTMRSNTKRLRIDFETAEAMLNHVKKGLERTYDRYELEEEKRLSFLKWEMEVAAIAGQAGVAEALGVPAASAYDQNGIAGQGSAPVQYPTSVVITFPQRMVSAARRWSGQAVLPTGCP
jgi:integrase